MKKIFLYILVWMAFSCSQFVDKPKNLIDEEKMALVIADLAINDQGTLVKPDGNMESGARYILKKHHVRAKDFADSYTYYTATQGLQPILEKAQEKVIGDNPQSEKYIRKKISEKPNVPAFAR